MSDSDSTNSDSDELTLNSTRPPEERMVYTYESVDGTRVDLDEPIPESELPEEADIIRFKESLSHLNEHNNFGIAHYRFADDDQATGIIKVLSPSERMGDYIETWEDAASVINEQFEQPEPDDEIIKPAPAGAIGMCFGADSTHSFDSIWADNEVPEEPFADAEDYN